MRANKLRRSRTLTKPAWWLVACTIAMIGMTASSNLPPAQGADGQVLSSARIHAADRPFSLPATTLARHDHVDQRTNGDGAGAREPLRDRLKPISEVRTTLGERESVYPIDYARRQFVPPATEPSPFISGREWDSRVHMWEATAFCHRPLYFEDENLERYGYSFGWAQPVVSATHFAGRCLAWPYLAGAYPTHRCIYNLGRTPAGSHTSYGVSRPPLSLRGALFEAGAISSLGFIIP